MDNAQVTITQADREAAADLIEAYWFGAGDAHDDMRRLAQSYRNGHNQGVWALAFARHRLENADDEEETHKIGVDEGRQEMVREIDLATGGDGEFRYCMNGDPDRHCPDAEAMKARVLDRFAARHRLERSEPVGWMGIESAPKDGSVFFAWCPNVGRVIMNIDGVHRNTWAVDRTYRLGCNPTHWMPLPSAPDTTPPEPVAEIERLRGALRRLTDERTLQTTIPEGPWTPEMVAEFQSKEVGHMRDLARAALGDAS